MHKENTEAVEQIYGEIRLHIGESALLLAHLMKQAFEIGLGREPAGKVDREAAYERTNEFFARAVQAGVEFDTSDSWPGFVYHIGDDPKNRAVLGGKDNDPLMYKVLALAKEFHKPVAQERGMDWFDNTISIHGHESVMTASVRRSMAQVRLTLLGLPPEMPRID